MDQVDAGNFLRTAQIKRFLDPARYPTTTFELSNLLMAANASFEAVMEKGEDMEVGGRLSYRSRSGDG